MAWLDATWPRMLSKPVASIEPPRTKTVKSSPEQKNNLLGYHIIQYGIILYNMVSYCTIWYHIVQYVTLVLPARPLNSCFVACSAVESLSEVIEVWFPLLDCWIAMGVPMWSRCLCLPTWPQHCNFCLFCQIRLLLEPNLIQVESNLIQFGSNSIKFGSRLN